MISPGDLRSPTGDLGDSLFPGESSGDLDTRLQGYIDEGEAKATAAGVDVADLEDAVKAWAYYRAYYTVYVRMLNAPSSVEMQGQGSKAHLWSQIEAMGKLADTALAGYRDLLPPAALNATMTFPPSGAVPNDYAF